MDASSAATGTATGTTGGTAVVPGVAPESSVGGGLLGETVLDGDLDATGGVHDSPASRRLATVSELCEDDN